MTPAISMKDTNSCSRNTALSVHTKYTESDNADLNNSMTVGIAL